MLIFGESAMNDAVAIILYRFVINLQEQTDVKLGAKPLLLSAIVSIGVFLGSFGVGIAMALVFAKITKHVWIPGYEGAIHEMIMLLAIGYGSYLVAEICSLAGIISIFFTGVGIAHYAQPNLTDLSKKNIKVTLRVMSIMCEGTIFLYLGLGLFSFGVGYNPLMVLLAAVAIFVGRFHVFIVCKLSEFLPEFKPIPNNQQVN
jgi:NhaP-type Na+/H+ or K+/H+ antiporter